jgi:hypothetical protein
MKKLTRAGIKLLEDDLAMILKFGYQSIFGLEQFLEHKLWHRYSIVGPNTEASFAKEEYGLAAYVTMQSFVGASEAPRLF